MISSIEWESRDGTRTLIKNLDTRHLANAIAVVERNDPRYGVRHGAAYPALLAEMAKRAREGDQEAFDHEVGAGRPTVDLPGWKASTADGIRARLRGLPVEPRLIAVEEKRLLELERRVGSVLNVSMIDDRAARAHRRLDRVDETLRALEADPRQQIRRRLDMVETAHRAHAVDLGMALARNAELTARVDALEAAAKKPKRKRARKVVAK